MPRDSQRPLGSHDKPRGLLNGLLPKLGVAMALIVLLGFLVSRIDTSHDLRRLNVTVLSKGDPRGHYFALIEGIAQRAKKRFGTVHNLGTAGSVENVKRLEAAAKSCDVQFGLVQDGTSWDDVDKKEGSHLMVYGRFARREAVLFLGKGADRFHDFVDLKGLRIGIGPLGSGTELIAQQMFGLPEFKELGVQISPHPLDKQTAMLLDGSLDLGIYVTQDDAPIVVDAIRNKGLQIASFASTEGVARRLPHLRTDHVSGGYYDAIHNLPPTDKEVMRVETLLLGNGCASRIQTIDLLTVISQEVPDFLRYNKDTENATALQTAPVAQEFITNGGPTLTDLYIPWLVDVMPPANWAYVVMGVSLLFNVMTYGHRFRLSRIDGQRVGLEEHLVRIFGKSITLGDIGAISPDLDAKYADPAVRTDVRELIKEFEELASKSRRQSVSFMVPMGQEMAYRYQEGVIHESLAVLRGFLKRAEAAG